MRNLVKEGLELQKLRKAAGLTQLAVRDLIQKADPKIKVSDCMVPDIEYGRAGGGPKATQVSQLMRDILSKKAPIAAPATSTKKITIQPNGFSLEASTNAVKQLAALGIPTGEVKAALIKTFSHLLDQAEK